MKCVRKLCKGFQCEVLSTRNLLTWQFTDEHKLREYLTASLVSPGFFEAAPNLRSSFHVCWLCCWRETCLSLQVWFFRLDFSVGFAVEYTNNNKPLCKGYHLNTNKYEAFSKSPMSRCLSLSAPASPPRSMWGWWVHQLLPSKDLHRHNESCG